MTSCCLSYNVPAGTHLIEVAALGYFFSPVTFFLLSSVCLYVWHAFVHVQFGAGKAYNLIFLPLCYAQVRVDISARNPGNLQAGLTENKRSLQELVLEPLKEEQYYEVSSAF